MNKAIAVRKALLNIDASDIGLKLNERMTAAIELEIARAYDLGHIDGSGVKNQTEAEIDLCNACRELTHYEVVVLGEHISPSLRQLIDAVRDANETEPNLDGGQMCPDSLLRTR